MRNRFVKALLIAVLLIAALALWKREAVMRLHAVNTLFSQDKIVHNFSNMDQLFHTKPLPVGAAAQPLPSGPALELPEGWQDWIDQRAVTALVILREGAVVHESYHMGTGPSDQRISWSVAKSYLSALFGVLLANGDVQSLDEPVTKYAPELVGSAYEQATIRNVLQMSSGVTFDEDYLDFWSDINKMGRVLALGASMDAFAAGLTERDAEPGLAWNYVSIDTHILSMVLRGATGQGIAELLGQHILTPLGAEGAPYYLTDGYGVAFALGGLNLTTRDYARMGEMFRNDGAFGDQQIVPKDWAIESTTPSARTEPGEWKYGYQWWMPHDARDGEFMARGIYGQYVYVDKQSGMVIAVNAADRGFRDAGVYDQMMDMFRKITAQKGAL